MKYFLVLSGTVIMVVTLGLIVVYGMLLLGYASFLYFDHPIAFLVPIIIALNVLIGLIYYLENRD
jgi:hypothetical protein